MGSLSAFFEGKSIRVKYSKEVGDSIYFTDAPTYVAYNFKQLKVRLDKLDNQYDDGAFVTEFGPYFVVTQRKSGKYSQHLFMGAARGDIYDFAIKMPKKIAQQIARIANL